MVRSGVRTRMSAKAPVCSPSVAMISPGSETARRTTSRMASLPRSARATRQSAAKRSISNIDILPALDASIWRLIRGCGGAESADLAGGVLQLLIAQPRCHVVLLGQRKKSAEPKRFLKECHGGVERALSLRDGQWDLCGQARPDVIMGAHTEGVEAQRERDASKPPQP